CNWTQAASNRLQEIAERSKIPVITAVRCQDVIDNRSTAYVGTLGLNTSPGLPTLVEQADLVVFLGTRPDALTMGDFSMLTPPRPAATVVHVYPDSNVFGRVYATDLGIAVSPEEFLAALPEQITAPNGQTDWLQTLRDNDAARSTGSASDELSAEYMSVFDE